MKLHGLDSQIAAFRAAMASERMHHAWLLAGPRGVGKASFGRAAAHAVLAGAPYEFALSADHPTSRLIAARSHPDFKLVEREIWMKGEPPRLVPYDQRKDDDKPSRNIRVMQIRWLATLLATSPSLSDRRVILIDAADDMERGAANAILKMLEEPPASTIFLLVSHRPGRLLPTIRSRCRTLVFGPLDDAAMTSVLDAQLPDLTGARRAQLMAAANGSPATALSYSALDMDTLDAALVELATTGDPSNTVRSKLAQSLALKAGLPRYEAFLEHAPAFIADRARQAGGARLEVALNAWSKARALAQIAIPQSLVAETVVFEMAGYVASLAHADGAVKA